MNDSPAPGAPRRASSAPDFTPVPVRARKDGWTPERQRDFIAALHRTRSITSAARAVGMTRETAYRLRARPSAESFAAAWDAAFALAPCRGAGHPDLVWHRARYGTIRPIVRGGREVGFIVRPDNKAAMTLLRRFDRLVRTIDPLGRSR